jgi:hypothetical protein
VGVPQTNTTCDIYRQGNAPPSAPDVAGVLGFLAPDFAPSHLANVTIGGSGSTAWRWTHVLLVGPAVDVRDGYAGTPGGETAPSGWDWVYVPDHTGTKFAVVFVERLGRGTTQDCKRVYLQRQAPTWPTNNL